MKRRSLLFATAAALTLTATPGLAQDEVTLRMGWWGNDARHALYNQLLDLYEEQNPSITVEREFTG